MLLDVRCPECNKLIGKMKQNMFFKKKQKVNNSDFYPYCSRCKKNIDLVNNKLIDLK